MHISPEACPYSVSPLWVKRDKKRFGRSTENIPIGVLHSKLVLFAQVLSAPAESTRAYSAEIRLKRRMPVLRLTSNTVARCRCRPRSTVPAPKVFILHFISPLLFDFPPDCPESSFLGSSLYAAGAYFKPQFPLGLIGPVGYLLLQWNNQPCRGQSSCMRIISSVRLVRKNFPTCSISTYLSPKSSTDQGQGICNTPILYRLPPAQNRIWLTYDRMPCNTQARWRASWISMITHSRMATQCLTRLPT